MEHDILELLAQAELPGAQSFQLDPRRAGQVLGRFQLPNPYFYVRGPAARAPSRR